MFNEPRNVAIYLVRRLRGDSLKGIGREFHLTKYSSVSSVIQRMEALISTDRRLKERIEELAEVRKSRLNPILIRCHDFLGDLFFCYPHNAANHVEGFEILFFCA